MGFLHRCEICKLADSFITICGSGRAGQSRAELGLVAAWWGNAAHASCGKLVKHREVIIGTNVWC